MGLLELFAIAVGLSMDAFAVAIGKGLCLKKMEYRFALLTGLFFGGFQALMPVIGYFLGVQFKMYLTAIDHWIIFLLLLLIGINMIREANQVDEEDHCEVFRLKSMLALSVATSIDALAVGFTFAFLHANIALGASVIGLTTFCFSVAGVKIGNLFGMRYKARAEIAGGIILIFIGIKILLEHLGILLQ